MVVKHCGKQIVRRAYSVEITREMEVDVLHRNNLRIAAAGCAALDSENRTERRLPERNNGVFSEPSESVRKTDGGGGLTLACGGGGDSRNKNKLSVFVLVFL